jgi:hypothetical protein
MFKLNESAILTVETVQELGRKEMEEGGRQLSQISWHGGAGDRCLKRRNDQHLQSNLPRALSLDVSFPRPSPQSIGLPSQLPDHIQLTKAV